MQFNLLCSLLITKVNPYFQNVLYRLYTKNNRKCPSELLTMNNSSFPNNFKLNNTIQFDVHQRSLSQGTRLTEVEYNWGHYFLGANSVKADQSFHFLFTANYSDTRTCGLCRSLPLVHLLGMLLVDDHLPFKVVNCN